MLFFDKYNAQIEWFSIGYITPLISNIILFSSLVVKENYVKINVFFCIHRLFGFLDLMISKCSFSFPVLEILFSFFSFLKNFYVLLFYRLEFLFHPPFSYSSNSLSERWNFHVLLHIHVLNHFQNSQHMFPHLQL